MKQVTLLFTGHILTAALLAFGKSIGAQFRDAHLAEGTNEPCDFVAGHNIPESYAGVEVHPEWENFDEDFVAPVPKDPDAPNKDDDEEIEVTLEYLEKLTKKQMLELVDEEELDFTPEQKKNAANLLLALKEHYEV